MTQPSAWSVVRLAELAAPGKGSIAGGPFGSDLVSADYVPEGVPVIRGTNLPTDQRLSLSGLVFVTEAKADSLHLNCAYPGDLVFTQRGTLGQVGLIPLDSPFPRYLISQSQMKMTVAPPKADPLYLYYYFRLPSTVRYIENHALQAGVPHINLGILRKLEVVAPPLDVQKKIAAILSTYDDLIANNQRRIALLEGMAEEIYREWFVRMRFPGHEDVPLKSGLPEGWIQRKLSDVAEINARSVEKGSEPELVRYIDISAVGTNEVAVPDEMPFSRAPGRARRIVRSRDILWSSVRPGNRAYCVIVEAEENMVASTGFAVISPRREQPFTYLHQATTTQHFVDQMVAVAKGSAYPAASFDDFAQARIIWPAAPILARYHEIAKPMYEQVHRLRTANARLGSQRDALLPRLISGKLKVDHLDIRLPPSMQAEATA